MIWERISNILNHVQYFLPLITVIVSSFGFLYIFLVLSPKVQLKIVPRWVNNEQVILHLEIKNQSRVRVKKQSVQLQIFEYDMSNKESIPEWVPFSKKDLDKFKKNPYNVQPRELTEPKVIFESTKTLYPGEIISCERLYTLSKPSSFLHVGLQFVPHSSFFTTGSFKSLRRTITAFVFPPQAKINQ